MVAFCRYAPAAAANTAAAAAPKGYTQALVRKNKHKSHTTHPCYSSSSNPKHKRPAAAAFIAAAADTQQQQQLICTG